jgi:serine/threonine-protein kinase SRPK3
VEILD